MRSLECRELTKSFDGNVAVSGVDLELAPPAIVALIGPNGAGKTTLLDLMTGFLKPTRGTCWVGGVNSTGLRSDALARLGVTRTFQSVRLVRSVPVIENVRVASSSRRETQALRALLLGDAGKEARRNEDLARHRLASVGLDQRASDLAGQLSFGQQKLLSVMCAAETGAEFLLLDEPFGGVDMEALGQVVRVVRGLKEDNRMILVVEHDLETVRKLADRVLVMDQGRVVADGIPDEIFAGDDLLELFTL